MKRKLRILYVSVEQAMMFSKIFIKYCKNDKNDIFTKVKKIFLRNWLHKKYNIIIGDECVIGENILFPHPQNIVIGSKVRIGENCTIYHDVTIGQNKKLYPIIGDNVIIYPGVKIIGNIIIGDNVIVGANSVVTKNVPENRIVAGVPAKTIGIRGANDEFY